MVVSEMHDPRVGGGGGENLLFSRLPVSVLPVLPVPHFGNFQSCAGEKKLSSRKKDLPVGKGCRSLSRGYRWLKEVRGEP